MNSPARELLGWAPAPPTADRMAGAGSRRPPCLWPRLLLVFALGLSVGSGIIYLLDRNHALRARQETVEIAGHHALRLGERLERGLSATYALAAIVRNRGGEPPDFEDLATEMLGIHGKIGALAIAPGGVVSQIVPLAGNERAVGDDLLRDPRRAREALAAIASRRLTLAGPFPLREGGVGVAGRLAVFVAGPAGDEQFWGFTTAVLRVDDLVEASGVRNLADAGYRFELARRDPDSGLREVFAGTSASGLVAPVSYAIQVPNGEWTLSLEPEDGWHTPPATLVAQCAAVVLAALLFVALAYYHFRQPLVLHGLVMARTRKLCDANTRLATEIAERAGERLYRRRAIARGDG